MIKVSGDVWVGNVYYRSKITSSTGIISQSIHSITQRFLMGRPQGSTFVHRFKRKSGARGRSMYPPTGTIPTRN
jgi:hypothetical protein